MLHIFTDSLTTLPKEMIEQLNIGIVPVYVVFSNAHVYRHSVDIHTEEILRFVMKTGKIPGIAAPTIQDFIQLFKSSVSKNDHVLFISMSAEISPAHRNAIEAAKHFPKGQVSVIDSTSFCSGTALMILKAASISKRARKIDTIEQRLYEYRRNLKEELFLDKIQAANYAGNVYGLTNRIISPRKLRHQLSLRIGSINSVLRTDRTTLSVLEDMLVRRLNEDQQVDRDPIVISETLAREPAEYMVNQINDRYGFNKVILTSNINGLLCRSAPRSLGISYLLQPVDQQGEGIDSYGKITESKN